jgi:hypothetical protein
MTINAAEEPQNPKDLWIAPAVDSNQILDLDADFNADLDADTQDGNFDIEQLLGTLIKSMGEMDLCDSGIGCKAENEEQKPENFCVVCSEYHCFEHIVSHIIDEHPDSSQLEPVTLTYLAAMMQRGVLSSYATGEWIIASGTKVPNRSRSAFLLQCEENGWQRGCILQLTPPKDPELEPHFIAEVKAIMRTLRVEAHIWTPNDKITLFCAQPLDKSYLPTDPEMKGPSLSGFVIDPAAEPGKIGKSIRVLKPAEGAFLAKASKWPRLNLPDNSFIRLAKNDSQSAGDGQGQIRESVAVRLLEAASAPCRPNTNAIQGVFTGRDFTFKGLFVVIPDDQWEGGDDVDFVIDEENFNHRLHNTKRTVVKVWAKAHKTNTGWFGLDVLNLGEAVLSRFSPQEITDTQLQLAQGSARRNFTEALEKHRAKAMSQDFLDVTWRDMNLEIAHRELALREQRERANLEIQLAGYSPWASSFNMEYLAGQTWKNWSAKYANHQPLPMMWLSGERVYAIHPPYANQSAPKRGYARITYDPRDETQMIGVGMHPKDVNRYTQALDTFDFDGDELVLVFFLKEGKPWVLILRSPSSVDSGVELQLNQADYRKVTKLGYHFYQYVGGPKFPGIHEKDDNGEPLHPYVLKAPLHQEQIVWTNDSDEAMAMMLRMTRYRGSMGIACNLMHILDRSGLYDPKQHHFNFSESVIDPSLTGARNPEAVILPMMADLYQAAVAGKPICECVIKRAQKLVDSYHYEQRKKDPKLPFKVTLAVGCPPSHHVIRDGAKVSTDWLLNDMNFKKLMSNGPAQRLLQEVPQDTLESVGNTYEARCRLWSEHMARSKEQAAEDRVYRQELQQVLETGYATSEQVKSDLAEYDERRRIERALATKRIKLEEHQLIVSSYYDCMQLESGQRGDYLQAWNQLAMTDQRRYNKPDVPVRTAVLSCLSLDEYQAYFEGSLVQPTVLARVKAPEDLNPDQTYRVEAREMVKKDGTVALDRKGNARQTFVIVDTDGNEVSGAYAESRPFIGLDLVYLGAIPTLELADPGSYKHRVTQVFQVTTPRRIQDLSLYFERKGWQGPEEQSQDDQASE